MKTNKSMNVIIGSVLVLFTIIQVFYFAQVDLVPTNVVSYIALKSFLIFAVETMLIIVLVIGILYLLPVVCVVQLSTIFITLKPINITVVLINEYNNSNRVVYSNDTYKEFQVIRC